MEWAVGVTTALRPQPTLPRCLASLSAAGWPEPRIFAEPDSLSDSERQRYPHTLRDVTLGPWPNWILALAELFQRQPNADAYMVVQDDALFCRNVRALLEELSWNDPRVGIVSPYCPAGWGSPNVGLNAVRGDWRLVGALTYIVPAASVVSLLTHAPLVQHRKTDRDGGLRHIDSIVGTWAQSAGKQVLYSSPSLVEHIGDSSSIYKDPETGGCRRASEFVGEQFDALEFEPQVSKFSRKQTAAREAHAMRDASPYHDFSISRHCWETIRQLVWPGMTTLEFGSGLSTLLFDAAGCQHTALEHDQLYAAPSDSVVLCALAGEPIRCYDWRARYPYDLVLVDGPPESIGRSGVPRVLEGCVHSGTIVVVDDTHRATERELVQTICDRFGLEPFVYPGERRTFTVCYPRR